MEERHFLEKASWVAGIVSAVIALAIWVKPGDSDLSPKQKQQDVVPEPAPFVVPEKGPTEYAGESKRVHANQTKAPPLRWSCAGIARDLAPAYKAAETISYTEPRNRALLALARKALCLENYEMFEKAANQIAYIDPRDEVYGDAVDFALNLRKFDLAEKYAKQIQYIDPRDAAMARIVAKASER